MRSEINVTSRNYKYFFNQVKFPVCEDVLSFLCIKRQTHGFSPCFASAVCVIVKSYFLSFIEPF